MFCTTKRVRSFVCCVVRILLSRLREEIMCWIYVRTVRATCSNSRFVPKLAASAFFVWWSLPAALWEGAVNNTLLWTRPFWRLRKFNRIYIG